MDIWVNDDELLNCTELQQGSIQDIDYNEAGHNNILDMDKQRSMTNQISSSIISIPTMPNDECVKVWNILQSWNIEYVYKTCIDQCIDTEVLSYMKSEHVRLLLANFPLGVQIKFEKYVHNFQTKEVGQNHIPLIVEPELIPVPVTQNIVPTNENKIFDLNQILTKSTQGSMIVEYYFKNKKLNESCRTLLVELIINDLIKKNRTMTIDLASTISNAIVMAFPTEIKDVYFLKDRTCKAPKGKVYVKYFNTMKKLKNGGLKLGNNNNNTSEIKKIVYRSEDLLNSSLEIEPDSEDMALSLLNDDDLSWPEVETIWQKTINFRLQYIRTNDTASIFNKWLHYTKPMGYKLIEIDFKRMYPNFKNLNVKFEKTLPTLLSILNDRVKDSGSVALLRQLKESTNLCKNSQTLILLYLLHSIFLPTTRKITLDDQGKKSSIKYSIKDSQNSFIIIAQTAVEVELILEKLKKQKNNIQPCILVVGSLLNPVQILVYFDDIKYKVFSAFKAVDICLKIFHVFNLEYPLQCNNVWLFLQIYYYEILTKYDRSSSLIRQICSEMDTNLTDLDPSA